MTPFLTRSAAAADTAAVAAIVAALESSFYGETLFSEADLQAEWERLDLARDAHVVLDGDGSSATARCRRRASAAASRAASTRTRTGAGSAR